MPKFYKTESEFETHFDKWLYVLKNLPRLENIPKKLQEKIFLKLFSAAEIAKYSEKDRAAYQNSVKIYRDLKNIVDTVVEDALEEFLLNIVKNGIENGFEDKTIALFTGLTIEKVAKLRDKIKNQPS